MENFRVRVQKLQVELKAPKSQFNKFGGYNYRSCEDIVEAVKPLESKYGVILNITDDIVLVGDRFYVKATASIMDTESDMSISSSGFAREAESKKGMDDSQVTGSASSYARKYALNGLLGIDDTKDADTNEQKMQQEQKPQEQKEPEKKDEINNLCFCERCKKAIMPKKYGKKEYKPKEIAENTKAAYGQMLCWDCSVIAKEELLNAGK